MMQSLLPHIRAALMSQLPSKQHTLLIDLDKIKKEYAEHHDKILDKFVNIIGGIVEHSLTPKVAETDFDQRAKGSAETEVECCSFIDGVITNTKKMHHVLHSLLPKEDMMDVFSRIFAHLDSKVPKIFLSMDSDSGVNFHLPESLEGKHRIIFEVEMMAKMLNSLQDVTPWEFGAMKFLRMRLEIDSIHGRGKGLIQEQGSSCEIATQEDTENAAVDQTDADQVPNKNPPVLSERDQINSEFSGDNNADQEIERNREQEVIF
jgi:hypothetical protein